MNRMVKHDIVMARAHNWLREHPPMNPVYYFGSEGVIMLRNAVLDILHEIEQAEENNESVRNILELDKKHSDYLSALDIFIDELEKI